jgi:hypothetical protein
MQEGYCCGRKMHEHHVGGHEVRRFLSRKEKIEMFERYRESLRNGLEGVEEALQELKRDS